MKKTGFLKFVFRSNFLGSVHNLNLLVLFLFRFKKLTGKDPIKSIVKLNDILSKDNKEQSKKDLLIEDIELLYEITWVLEKGADDSKQDMIEWIESFEVFQIAEIIVDLIELLQKAFSSTLTMNNKKK